MQTEIEVKFCEVDIDDMRVRLKKAGAVCEQPMRLMRRQVFWLVSRDSSAYVRVRDEGHRATLTYKHFEDKHSLTSATEAEVVVSDFETTRNILINSGLEPKSYQETRRETWKLGSVEIVIDEWPWLPPFVEIEGNSEVSVKDVAARLGFDWGEAVFGAATEAYRASYKNLPQNFIMDDLPEIRFDLSLPNRLKVS